MILKLALIGLFGGAGSVLRYLIAGWTQPLSGAGFPIGTLAVNLLGCIAIGVVGAIFAAPHMIREEWRFAIMVGLLGGFTTFSTFSFETFELINDGQFTRAGINVLVTNLSCLAGAWIGYRVTEHIVGV